MVRGRRRRRGFERAGALAPAQLGMPLGRARELVLERAWREVAGEIIARHAPALRVERGVVEIRIPHGPWGLVLPELLAQLAGQLAARHPALGVTSYRPVTDGSAVREPALPVPRVSTSPEPRPARPPQRVLAAAASGEPPAPPTAARLTQVVERYLARVERQARQRP